VAKVDMIHDGKAIIQERFPPLFDGLWAMSDEYAICLKPDAMQTTCFIYS